MESSLYENKEFGFRIKYPKDWELLDNHPLYTTTFLSEYEESSKYRVEVIMNAIDLSEKFRTFEELIGEGPSTFKVFLNDFTIFNQKETLFGGKKAHQMLYSGKMKFGRQKDLDLKYLQTMTLIDNISYSLSYSHRTKFIDKYLDTINEMIESFDFF